MKAEPAAGCLGAVEAVGEAEYRTTTRVPVTVTLVTRPAGMSLRTSDSRSMGMPAAASSSATSAMDFPTSSSGSSALIGVTGSTTSPERASRSASA